MSVKPIELKDGLREAGRLELPAPAYDLFRVDGGYTVCTREGLFFSEALNHAVPVLRPAGAALPDDADDTPPRVLQAGDFLFCFWRGEDDQYASRDGKEWVPCGLPASYEKRPLTYRGAFPFAGGFAVWASYNVDNANLAFEDDLIYDSYFMSALLFVGKDPWHLELACSLEEAFPRHTVAGIVEAGGQLAVLCVSEPPRKNMLSCATSQDGRTFRVTEELFNDDFGISTRDYKINYAYNRTKLFSFQDHLYAKGYSLFAVDAAAGTLADIHPDRVPSSFEYLKVSEQSILYHGTDLWGSRDMVFWNRVCDGNGFGQSFVVDDNGLTVLLEDGRVMTGEFV